MLWLAIDLLLALVAVGLLLLVAVRLWHKVRAFSRAVGEASTAVGVAADALAAAQAQTRA